MNGSPIREVLGAMEPGRGTALNSDLLQLGVQRSGIPQGIRSARLQRSVFGLIALGSRVSVLIQSGYENSLRSHSVLFYPSCLTCGAQDLPSATDPEGVRHVLKNIEVQPHNFYPTELKDWVTIVGTIAAERSFSTKSLNRTQIANAVTSPRSADTKNRFSALRGRGTPYLQSSPRSCQAMQTLSIALYQFSVGKPEVFRQNSQAAAGGFKSDACTLWWYTPPTCNASQRSSITSVNAEVFSDG
jgi:hypothetical protein